MNVLELASRIAARSAEKLAAAVAEVDEALMVLGLDEEPEEAAEREQRQEQDAQHQQVGER